MELDKISKIGLAILLLICLLDMPYGYYAFIRFVAMVVFGIFAFQAFDKEWNTTMVVYIALAILFQPMFKIALGRPMWNVVDVIVAVYLIVSISKPNILESK